MISVGGIQLLPDFSSFLAFALAGLALNLVPGLDMAFVTASSARRGTCGGVIAALGIGAGTLVHISLAVIGVASILASSPQLMTTLKIAGCLYLLYVGSTLWAPHRQPTSERATPASLAEVFWQGFLINLLNPKVALFLLAFLPQFVDAGAESPSVQIASLGVWFDAVGTVVNCLIAFLTTLVAQHVDKGRWGQFSRRLGAVILACLALRMLLD